MKRRSDPRRAGFTMIEVLTVAAIVAIIMGLTIPAYGWMAEGREREKVSETIAAQVMGARALAVQYRTYAGVMVRCVSGTTQCAAQRAGTIRMIQVRPRDVNDPVWNKSFHWVTGRGAAGIPNGVGFVRGTRPTAGTAAADLVRASTFFIVFGPDGILRSNWPVQHVYTRNPSTGITGDVLLDMDRAAAINGSSRVNCLPANIFFNNAAATSAPSVTCYAVYDWKRLLEETRQNTQVAMTTTAAGVTNPGGLLTRLYSAATVGSLVRHDLLCTRTFLNPYTGLGIREVESAIDLGNPASPVYIDLEP